MTAGGLIRVLCSVPSTAYLMDKSIVTTCPPPALELAEARRRLLKWVSAHLEARIASELNPSRCNRSLTHLLSHLNESYCSINWGPNHAAYISAKCEERLGTVDHTSHAELVAFEKYGLTVAIVMAVEEYQCFTDRHLAKKQQLLDKVEALR